MGRPLPGGAVNASREERTVYGVDPRGWALFAALSAVAQRGLNGTAGGVYGTAKGAPEATWNGDLGRPVQSFLGQAALGRLGLAQPIPDGGAAQLVNELSSGPLQDPAMRIFAARLRRGAWQ